MRGIIITRTGNFYITDEKPERGEDREFILAKLATRGEVAVPISNIEAIEWYDDYEIETFRLRHTELKAKVAK